MSISISQHLDASFQSLATNVCCLLNLWNVESKMPTSAARCECLHLLNCHRHWIAIPKIIRVEQKLSQAAAQDQGQAVNEGLLVDVKNGHEA